MKIAVAQSRPIVGPVEGNIAGHQSLIDLAVRNNVRLIVFPELSLTGYEPPLAASHARSHEDTCFASLRSTAVQHGIYIAVGVPTLGHRLPCISTLVFEPNSELRVYSKQHLHPDEEPFFEPGPESDAVIHTNPTIALAICYELSVPTHSQRAIESGATVYIASVAKTAHGVDIANERLSEIARVHSTVVMMANCLGMLDSAECVGRSSAWNRNGTLLKRLEATHEGIIVVDYDTEAAAVAILSNAGRQ
ncbi:carbon-nitrogen hydrolase family protein [Roseiconus lacunae]|uniref:carbon-nitrogen hydrolase family protein n=2 Tax=Roseiconus lacunae TaxID=2605694 RepID=UPI00331464BA